MTNAKENCEIIWKMWKKSKLNSVKIRKIWKKGKLNSEKMTNMDKTQVEQCKDKENMEEW